MGPIWPIVVDLVEIHLADDLDALLFERRQRECRSFSLEDGSVKRQGHDYGGRDGRKRPGPRHANPLERPIDRDGSYGADPVFAHRANLPPDSRSAREELRNVAASSRKTKKARSDPRLFVCY